MLVGIVRIMARHGINMPLGAVQEMLDMWKRFQALTEDIDCLHTPKRHALTHMILKTPRQGNPRGYANWLDESLNKVLKAACREISQSTFEPFILMTMPELLRRGAKRTRAGATRAP